MNQEPVAIVGIGVLLPGASTVDQYWQNLVTGTDSITDIPARRDDPSFYGGDGDAPDRTYGRRGGFVADTIDFDPVAFGVPPTDIAGMEPDQLVALATAAAAIDDAGGPGTLGDRSRVGVILGRGGYLSPGLMRFDQRVRTVRQITRTIGELVPSAGPDVLERVRTALLEPLGEFRPESTIGLVPNLAASRVANRLDLGGPAYTVDAACASSLVAVDQAIGELVRRRCDVVLAGGTHHCHDDTLWSMFTQLGALSPSQRIRPLANDADGLLIGEGTAVVVLKRLDDARRDRNRVYAVLRGSGTSSDGKGASLFNPSVTGQVLALRRAWAAAGIDPATPDALGLLEAHGTATKAGDAAELTTLTEVFGSTGEPNAVIGSVKSMIGHTLPTAGVAGLVKVALALHHGVLTPTLHCAEANPLLARTRFRPLAEAQPWPRGDSPRRAAVNAFGFGGVNAHVVVEEGDSAAPRRARVAVVDAQESMLRLAGGSPEELLRLLDRPEQSDVDGDGRCRIGIARLDDKRLAVARRVVAKVAATGEPWHGKMDIWCTVDPILRQPGAKTVFVHPGLEDGTAPRYDDVAKHFGLDRPIWSTASVFEHASSVSGVGLLLDAALRRASIRADAHAGHSVGEWTAMQAAGMYLPLPSQDALGRYWPDGFALPDADFLMLGCSMERADRLLSDEPEVVISHDNAPQQIIVCGPPEAITRLAHACQQSGIVSRKLAFRSGFHTPLLGPQLGAFGQLVADLDLTQPRTPVWSATTVAPYPDTPEHVRELFLAHLVRRVRFRELTEAMYAQGFRVFVQVGAGNLGSFVTDTLGSRRHLVIAAGSSERTGMAQLRRVATALWTEGARPRFDAFRPRRIRLNTSGSLLSVARSARGLLDQTAPLPTIPAGVSDEIAREFAALLDETKRSAVDVVKATARSATLRSVRTTVEVSLAARPHLRDHRIFRQRTGWPDEADFRPVVPATGMIDIACREVEKAWPGAAAVGVCDAAFMRWLVAEPPRHVPLTMTRDRDQVEVQIGEHARMTVELAETFPPAPTRSATPGREAPAQLHGTDVYARREMFHGPAYQGLAELTGIGDGHIRGELVVPSAPGALLDNIGQLLGCWLMSTQSDGLLAFPRAIGRISWYGPEPGPGNRVSALATIRQPRPDLLEMDAEVVQDGRVAVRIERWQDVRFPCDRTAHAAYAFPDRHRLSDTHDGGWVSVTDRWPGVAARELYAGVYLNGDERTAFAECPPRQQRAWLLERIAIKDAVRVRLAEDGIAAVFPAEIQVHGDGAARNLTVSGRHGRTLPDLAVAVATTGEVAVAIAQDRAAGVPLIAVRQEDDRAGLVDETGSGAHIARIPGHVVAWTPRHEVRSTP